MKKKKIHVYSVFVTIITSVESMKETKRKISHIVSLNTFKYIRSHGMVKYHVSYEKPLLDLLR